MAESRGSRGSWGSRWGFILAAAGSAVGLGNIWKFPYITGENGGGLFVLIYLVCIALVGLPIMVAELMIGRAAQKQPVGAFEVLQGRRTAWSGVGWLGVVSGFVILSYYIVVAGWAMDYTLKSVVNFTKDIHEKAEDEATVKLASTALATMRAELAENDARHAARNEIAALKSGTPESVFKDKQRFDEALAAAQDKAEARSRLFLDGAFRANVEHVQHLERKEKAVTDRHLEEARKAVAALPEKELLSRYDDLVRRALVKQKVTQTFLSMAGDGWVSVFWSLLFMLITIIVVSMGISGGIERWCKVLMPTLIILILVMVGYGMTTPGFGEGLAFVFKPDLSKLQASGVLEALGHAFFTLSLGMGAMITYGSYQKGKEGLVGQAVAIAGMDTLIALLACMMMFPIVFSYGQEPASGPGLVFMSMPLAFSEMGEGGLLLGLLFFGLLVFAALTSAISLLEVVASYFIDVKGWSRRNAAWLLGGAIFLFSVPSSFAMDPETLMGSWKPTFGKNFFDTMDYLASNWLLAIGGLLIALYAGWFMPRRVAEAELEGAAAALLKGWLLLIRFVAPLLVLIVLAQKVGLLQVDRLFFSPGG